MRFAAHRLLVPLFLVLHTPCAAVDLGGTPVPPERFIVYIFTGHSNMSGRAPDQDNTPRPRCWYYDVGFISGDGRLNDDRNPRPYRPGEASYRWVPATDRAMEQDGRGRGRVGPVYHFLKIMAERYPDHHFGAIKLAQGGLALPPHLAIDPRTGRTGVVYSFMTGLWREIEGDATLGGIVSMQRNGGGRTPEATWREWLIRLVGDWRQAFGPEVPIIFDYKNIGSAGPPHLGYPDLPRHDPAGRTAITSEWPRSWFQDAVHFDNAGHRAWCREVADLIRARGWDDWARRGGSSEPGATAGSDPAPAADAPAAPAASEPAIWPVHADDLVWVWSHALATNQVRDPRGGVRVCAPLPRGWARYDRFHGMDLAGGRFLAEEANAAAAARACSRAGALTLECLITPPAERSREPAHVLHFAGERGVNLALVHEDRDLHLVLRTSTTPRSGSAPLELLSLDGPATRHLAVTYDGRVAIAYLDGRPVAMHNRIAGPVDWEAGRLAFGAAPDGAHGWDGRLEHVALHARALTRDEIAAHHALLAEELAAREPVERVVVRARLAAVSSVPEGAAVLDAEYPRALVQHVWEVQRVLEGTCDATRIAVAHWAVLDLQVPPRIAGWRPGVTARLELEPYDAHPEIEAECLLVDDAVAAEVELPLFYDVGEAER